MYWKVFNNLRSWIDISFLFFTLVFVEFIKYSIKFIIYEFFRKFKQEQLESALFQLKNNTNRSLSLGVIGEQKEKQ